MSGMERYHHDKIILKFNFFTTLHLQHVPQNGTDHEEEVFCWVWMVRGCLFL